MGAVLKTVGVRPGESVAVFGCAAVGLSAVGAAMLVLNAGEGDPVEAILEFSHGGVDHPFECVGLPQLMDQAYRSMRVSGSAVICRAAPLGHKPFIDPLPSLHGKDILGSVAGPTRFAIDLPRPLRVYLNSRLPLDKLISRTYALEGVKHALKTLRKG